MKFVKVDAKIIVQFRKSALALDGPKPPTLPVINPAMRAVESPQRVQSPNDFRCIYSPAYNDILCLT